MNPKRIVEELKELERRVLENDGTMVEHLILRAMNSRLPFLSLKVAKQWHLRIERLRETAHTRVKLSGAALQEALDKRAAEQAAKDAERAAKRRAVFEARAEQFRAKAAAKTLQAQDALCKRLGIPPMSRTVAAVCVDAQAADVDLETFLERARADGERRKRRGKAAYERTVDPDMGKRIAIAKGYIKDGLEARGKTFSRGGKRVLKPRA